MSDTRGRGGGSSSRGATRSTRGTARSRGNSSQLSNPNPSAIPSGSVSKIKAQLRQTKRLLSKEDLNPEVKITSQRRLVALQDELVKAEKGLLEKKMVTKYRGVKFFERQKVLRRIKQAKKSLEIEKDETKLEESRNQLFDARMDLYYILRYPKTEKYLALYPENTYITFSTSPSPSPSSSSTITPSDPSTSTSKASTSMNESERKRWELRNEIRRKVGEGSWAEESEGGDLGIEGEEEDHEELQPIAAVKGEKRGRESRVEAAEEGEKEVVVKKRKVEEKNEEEEVVQEEEKEEKEVEEGEPKPLNRKQKKALKKALEAEAASEPTPTTKEKEKENEGDDGLHEDGEGEGEGKKLNRKQKKALKRAQEAGQVEAPPVQTAVLAVEKKEQVVNGKGVKGKKVVEKKKEPETKAEKLAMEDDFFA